MIPFASLKLHPEQLYLPELKAWDQRAIPFISLNWALFFCTMCVLISKHNPFCERATKFDFRPNSCSEYIVVAFNSYSNGQHFHFCSIPGRFSNEMQHSTKRQTNAFSPTEKKRHTYISSTSHPLLRERGITYRCTSLARIFRGPSHPLLSTQYIQVPAQNVRRRRRSDLSGPVLSTCPISRECTQNIITVSGRRFGERVCVFVWRI